MDATKWDERYAASELVWSAGPNQFLVTETAGLPVGAGLDLACGEGRNAIWLASRGWTMTAVDFSSVAIDKARAIAEHHGLDITFAVEDLTQWAPPPASFDLVCVFYLQLTAPERLAVWDRAAAAVAPGGVLLVVGHDSRNLTDGYGGPQSADVLYVADEIAGRLDGFVVERAGEVIREVELGTGGVASAIDCLVRARRT